MREPDAKTDLNRKLREMAESRLSTGAAGMGGSYSLGVDALNLLHRLSADPDTASDALKLLHELQVHQVEIDLQTEAIQNDEQLLVDELAYYRTLYEAAPVGYFLVDFEGRILRANQAGAELFGRGAEALSGEQITGFLTSDSHGVLPAMLQRLRQGDAEGAVEAFTTGVASSGAPLKVTARLSPDTRCALLVCCNIR